VVMITGRGDEELAYLSLRMGASGYAAKDKKLSVMLTEAVEWALADQALKDSEQALRERERAFREASSVLFGELQDQLASLQAQSGDLKKLLRGQKSSPSAPAVRESAAAVHEGIRKASSLAGELVSLMESVQEPRQATGD
jgi:hypothetical protein